MQKNISIFLDSGAFSAWSQGITINIDEYIQFIKENKKYIDQYAVLDVIGDAEATLKNQKYMEKYGVNPLPCFHYGEDKKYLSYYVSNYEYIALGGMVPISTENLFIWLDDIFNSYICNNDEGIPKIKVHGFGITSLPILVRYPWYSVDSTSWVMTGRFGAVYVPKKINNKYIYNEIPHKIIVSDKSDVGDAKHFKNFSLLERKTILQYFAEHNVTEKELAEDYMARDQLNIQYFLDLEKNLPQWPWNFKLKSQSNNLGLI